MHSSIRISSTSRRRRRWGAFLFALALLGGPAGAAGQDLPIRAGTGAVIHGHFLDQNSRAVARRTPLASSGLDFPVLPESVKIGDLDGDGDDDVVVLDPQRRSLLVSRGGTSAALQFSPWGTLPDAVRFRDGTFVPHGNAPGGRLIVPPEKSGEPYVILTSPSESVIALERRADLWMSLPEARIIGPAGDGSLVEVDRDGNEQFRMSLSPKSGSEKYRRSLSPDAIPKGHKVLGFGTIPLYPGSPVPFTAAPNLVLADSPRAGHSLIIHSLRHTGTDWTSFLGDFSGSGSTESLLVLPGNRPVKLSRWFGGQIIEGEVTGFHEALAGGRILGAADLSGDGRSTLLVADANGLAGISVELSGSLCTSLSVKAEGSAVAVSPRGDFSLAAPLDRSLLADIEGDDDCELLPETIELTPFRANAFQVPIYTRVRSSSENTTAELPAGFSNHGPFTCIGVDPVERTLGGTEECPRDYAMFDVTDGGSLPTGNCCRLPAGALLEEEVWIPAAPCPPQWVATGVQGENSILRPRCPGCREAIRCTRINPKLIRLGPAKAGSRYGESFHMSLSRPEPRRLDIPLAVRTAFGRFGPFAWAAQGCLGLDFGSVFVGGGFGDCDQMQFAKILPADGPGGSTFPFPDCLTMPDPFNPSRGCRTADSPGKDRAPATDSFARRSSGRSLFLQRLSFREAVLHQPRAERLKELSRILLSAPNEWHNAGTELIEEEFAELGSQPPERVAESLFQTFASRPPGAEEMRRVLTAPATPHTVIERFVTEKAFLDWRRALFIAQLLGPGPHPRAESGYRRDTGVATDLQVAAEIAAGSDFVRLSGRTPADYISTVVERGLLRESSAAAERAFLAASKAVPGTRSFEETRKRIATMILETPEGLLSLLALLSFEIHQVHLKSLGVNDAPWSEPRSREGTLFEICGSRPLKTTTPEAAMFTPDPAAAEVLQRDLADAKRLARIDSLRGQLLRGDIRWTDAIASLFEEVFSTEIASQSPQQLVERLSLSFFRRQPAPGEAQIILEGGSRGIRSVLSGFIESPRFTLWRHERMSRQLLGRGLPPEDRNLCDRRYRIAAEPEIAERIVLSDDYRRLDERTPEDFVAGLYRRVLLRTEWQPSEIRGHASQEMGVDKGSTEGRRHLAYGVLYSEEAIAVSLLTLLRDIEAAHGALVGAGREEAAGQP